MNDSNEKKLSLYNTVVNYCKSNSVVIAGVPALVATVNDLTKLLQGVHDGKDNDRNDLKP